VGTDDVWEQRSKGVTSLPSGVCVRLKKGWVPVDVFNTSWWEEGHPASKLCTSYPSQNVLSVYPSFFTAVFSPVLRGLWWDGVIEDVWTPVKVHLKRWPLNWHVYVVICMHAGDVESINLESFDVSVVANMVKKYLRELPDLVIPEDSYSSYIEAASMYTVRLCKTFPHQLNFSSFLISLTSFTQLQIGRGVCVHCSMHRCIV